MSDPTTLAELAALTKYASVVGLALAAGVDPLLLDSCARGRQPIPLTSARQVAQVSGFDVTVVVRCAGSFVRDPYSGGSVDDTVFVPLPPRPELGEPFQPPMLGTFQPPQLPVVPALDSLAVVGHVSSGSSGIVLVDRGTDALGTPVTLAGGAADIRGTAYDPVSRSVWAFARDSGAFDRVSVPSMTVTAGSGLSTPVDGAYEPHSRTLWACHAPGLTAIDRTTAGQLVTVALSDGVNSYVGTGCTAVNGSVFATGSFGGFTKAFRLDPFALAAAHSPAFIAGSDEGAVTSDSVSTVFLAAGSFVYTCSQTLVVISLVDTSVAVAGATAVGGLAFAPGLSRLYASVLSGAGDMWVTAYSYVPGNPATFLASRHLGHTSVLGRLAWDGSRLWAADPGNNLVRNLDPTSLADLATVTVPNSPVGLAVAS